MRTPKRQKYTLTPFKNVAILKNNSFEKHSNELLLSMTELLVVDDQIHMKKTNDRTEQRFQRSSRERLSGAQQMKIAINAGKERGKPIRYKRYRRVRVPEIPNLP